MNTGICIPDVIITDTSDSIENPVHVPGPAVEWTERNVNELYPLTSTDFQERYNRWDELDLGKTKFGAITSYWDQTKEHVKSNCRAVKRINLCSFTESVRTTIIRKVAQEIEIFRKLQTNAETEMFDDGHPNIVKLHCLYWDKGSYDEMNLSYEICNNQTLYRRFKGLGRSMSEAEARPVIQEIVSALQFMHERNIIHRDLRMGTIIQEYSPTGEPSDLSRNKICSMDNAVIMSTDQDISALLSEMPHRYAIWDSVQSREYIKGMKSQMPGLSYNKSTDVYALGTILYKLLTSTDYYGGAVCCDHEMLSIEYLNGHGSNYHLNYNPYWKSCQYCALSSLSTRARLSFERFETFLPRVHGSNPVTDLLSKLLDKDRNERMKTNDILLHEWFSSPTPSTPNHEPEHITHLSLGDAKRAHYFNKPVLTFK